MFLDYFRRITSKGQFIPEIDGLRFIAIISVLIFHLDKFLHRKMGVESKDQILGLSFLDPFFEKGWYGVEIFFVISGFILSLPLVKGSQFSYKKYLLRRVTRLEPPYILTCLVFFLGLVLRNTYSFEELFPHLITSLLYINNLVFPDTLPKVNGVAWSLEIEVQFYLLSPLIGLFFRKRNHQLIYYIGLALLFIGIESVYHPNFFSIISFGSYFMLGFILSERYLFGKPISVNPFIREASGLFSFALMWFLLLYKTGERESPFYLLIIEHINLFFFFYSVLILKSLNWFFSNKIIATIGGMCYSMYLLHYPIISLMGEPLVLWIKNIVNPTITYYSFMILFSIFIIILTGLFFIFFERPFMKKDWYKSPLNQFLYLKRS